MTESMRNHTPGPWEYSTIAYQITAKDGPPVCSLNGFTQNNAQLIAAAPDMLKALRLVGMELCGWIENEDLPEGMAADMMQRWEAIHEVIKL